MSSVRNSIELPKAERVSGQISCLSKRLFWFVNKSKTVSTRMDDKRNFRSTYYEKVGCRGVEERKSLEILLKDKPLNVLKLKQFCILFTVPNIHRNVLWNFLLGEISNRSSSS